MYDFGRMNKVKKWQWGLLFFVLCALCFLYPYTGDDWAWGSSIGIERLNTWFDNYSGRYFGNLIVLALTRSIHPQGVYPIKSTPSLTASFI